MNKISVIVPVYNVEKYLKKCIDSVLSQSYGHFELLLIDDGSTDSSGKICDEYGHRDPRIKVVHQNNQGLSSARNAGIDLASGEYITFIDSDDYIDSHFLDILHNNSVKYGADISVCKYKTFYENQLLKDGHRGKTKVMSPIEACSEIVKKSNAHMIVACGKLYQRNLFLDIRYPVGKHHEDEFTTYQLFYAANCVTVTNSQLYFYLQRQHSIMNTQYNLNRLDKLEALLVTIDFFKHHEEKELEAFAHYRYLLNLQIAAYKMLYESDLKDEYQRLQKAYHTHIKSLENALASIGLVRRLTLKIFDWLPRITLMCIHGIIRCIGVFKRRS